MIASGSQLELSFIAHFLVLTVTNIKQVADTQAPSYAKNVL